MDLSAERVARNDSLFRDANERIKASADAYGFDEPVPFICECADPGCSEIVHVSLAAYEDVRSHPTRFLAAPGHVDAEQELGRVVEERGGYSVLEKLGRAGDVAAELDPRGGTEDEDV